MGMFDLIKQNAVPAAMVRTAARGALSVPAHEMLDILVYLTNNPVFAQEARMTLASWDEKAAIDVITQRAASPEVLNYYWSRENRRPALMPALIENPGIDETQLAELAAGASRELAAMLLASPRARGSQAVMQALGGNPNLTAIERRQLQPAAAPETSEPPDPETEVAHENWKQEHAAEIAAEEGKAFELTGDMDEVEAEAGAEEAPKEQGPAQEATPSPEATAAAAAPEPAAAPRPRLPGLDEQRLTILQRVSRMNVSERVKTAFVGNKEERAILIRDGSKVVQNAVLSSPKLSDPEVESFSAARNLQENVLREIARSRRFLKNYPVVRNLVNNPRCPLDVALTLIKNLLVHDLKSLKGNKNISETVRNVATKLYKEKMTPPGQKVNY